MAIRDIIFHGKRLDNGEWVEGNLFVPDKFTKREPPTEILVGTNVVRISYEVDPETVGQYTGLCDKNNKKIFEGDICQIKNQPLISEAPFMVAWEDFVFNGWIWKDLGREGAEDSFTPSVAQKSVVIGTIHDNPELLEVDNV